MHSDDLISIRQMKVSGIYAYYFPIYQAVFNVSHIGFSLGSMTLIEGIERLLAPLMLSL